MQILYGILLIFLIESIYIETNIQQDSCITNNHVHCNLRNGSQACCPIKEGVCCLDSDFCCPKSTQIFESIFFKQHYRLSSLNLPEYNEY